MWCAILVYTTLPEIVRYTSEDLIDPSLFVAEQRYWPLLSGVTSAMYSVGNVSPTRTRSFLNQATVGFGYPVVRQVKVALSPSRTLVFVGGCVKTGELGCGGAVNQRERERVICTGVLPLIVGLPGRSQRSPIKPSKQMQKYWLKPSLQYPLTHGDIGRHSFLAVYVHVILTHLLQCSLPCTMMVAATDWGGSGGMMFRRHTYCPASTVVTLEILSMLWTVYSPFCPLAWVLAIEIRSFCNTGWLFFSHVRGKYGNPSCVLHTNVRLSSYSVRGPCGVPTNTMVGLTV